MRIKVILLGSLLGLLNCGWAQSITFNKAIVDGSGNVGWSVVEEPDGYIIVGGGWDDQRSMIQTKLFKTDIYGNVVSSKMYGTTGQFSYPGEAGSVCRTTDGNYAFAGTIDSSGIGFAWFVKFNSQLDTIWTKRYFNGLYDAFYKCKVTSDSGFAIVGGTSSFGNDVQFYFVKTDSIGNIEWQKVYGSRYREVSYSFALKPDGGFLLAGGKYLDNTFDTRVGYLVNTDKNGSVLHDTIYGTRGDDGPIYVNELSDTTYMLWGFQDTISTNYAPFFSKLDSVGHPVWFNLMSTGHRSHYIVQCRQLSDGNILVAGERRRPPDNVNSPLAVWLMKVDQMGEKIWERMYSYDTSGNESTWLRDFQETRDNGFIITGMANTREPGELNLQNFLLLKLDSLGCLEGDCGLLTNVPEAQKQPVELSVFPNPAKEAFTIKYALPYGLHNNPQVVLYNLQGKQVYQSLLYKAHDMLKVPTADLGSGMYIYQLVSGGKVLASGKVMVE